MSIPKQIANATFGPTVRRGSLWYRVRKFWRRRTKNKRGPPCPVGGEHDWQTQTAPDGFSWMSIHCPKCGDGSSWQG